MKTRTPAEWNALMNYVRKYERVMTMKDMTKDLGTCYSVLTRACVKAGIRPVSVTERNMMMIRTWKDKLEPWLLAKVLGVSMVQLKALKLLAEKEPEGGQPRITGMVIPKKSKEEKIKPSFHKVISAIRSQDVPRYVDERSWQGWYERERKKTLEQLYAKSKTGTNPDQE